jgi:hypothetical protein
MGAMSGGGSLAPNTTTQDTDDILLDDFGVTVTRSVLVVGGHSYQIGDIRRAHTHKEGRQYVLRLDGRNHRDVKVCWSDDLGKIKKIEAAVRQAAAATNPNAEADSNSAQLEAGDFVGLPRPLLEHVRSSSVRDVLVHGAIASAGVVLTATSYTSADPNGGKYVVFFGAILFGGYRALQALDRYLRSTAALSVRTSVPGALATVASNLVDRLRTVDRELNGVGAPSASRGSGNQESFRTAPPPVDPTEVPLNPADSDAAADVRYCGRCGAIRAQPRDRYCSRRCGDEL